MSKLAEFRQLQRDLADRLAALEGLKNDSALQVEIEFENQLRSLLGEYGKSLRDVVSLLDPSKKASVAQAVKRTRRARVVKTYRNPLTGETVASKGGNNKLLGAWKAQFGHAEVETWVQR